ncbi:poly-beta-1,6-N-acetyl-D-glucosamine synthase [Methanobrevibacter woesei]|uniref:Poly-beta-1,6-N-acetyl-D-glucosamine synthase n=2 Tax=Methanobrevibacter woesei TaxID=190976 RepID=A0A2U1S685_9EURY|nr:poly-beta-1,6-N-acetyl-D-glucosamine synthase [Methanobrevibacter woesei]
MISMKVSVVTPNYNGKDFLYAYFESLIKNSNEIGEVIIVDNGSRDGSQEFIRNYREKVDFPIVLIENSQNLGFAEAVNQGISKARYDYIFSLNNDTVVEKSAILELLNLLNTEERIFSVSSKMVQFNNPELIDDAGDDYTLLAYTKKRGNNQNLNKFIEVSEVFSSCAGAALYRKDLLEELGGFDSEFFAYMEDVDLGYRARINGYKNLFCPNAIVYHIGSATTGSQYNEFKVRLAARNNVLVVYKNLPTLQKIVNILFLFLGFLIKYLFFLKKGFGPIYLEGLKEGLKTRNKIKKVEFKSKNWKNYFKIEYELIKNTFKLLKR